MSGKGSENTRDYDRRAYWDSPLWNNMKTKRRKNQDIWDANKDEAIKMGIEVVKMFDCISCFKSVDIHKIVYVGNAKKFTFCEDCTGCYTLSEIVELRRKYETQTGKE